MLGRVLPIRLPFSPSEDALIVRRQNKLARDIELINMSVRNSVLSRSEGAKRIRFKQSEIDELQRYRYSKRTPTGRLSPPPAAATPAKSKKPANKYNPYAEDTVNSATSPNQFDIETPTYKRADPEERQNTFSTAWTEDDRPSSNSQTETQGRNGRGFLEMDYYNQLVKNYKARANRDTVPKAEMQRISNVAANAWVTNAPMFENVKPVKKTVKDNPHSFDYGSSYTTIERSHSFNAAKKHNGRYYGPKYGKNKLGFKVSSSANKKKWDAWNKANNIAGFAGMPNHLIRNKSKALRDTALMRKRAGARINFDDPNMTNNTKMRSWETYAKPEDVAMIKSMIPQMTGLEKFPELTPAGNAMMIELVNHNNDPKKMELAANKLLTDLMNKSGYFVKKYNVEVDPMQRKVKISEMSGLAGGLTKTRNSMQRLLK